MKSMQTIVYAVIVIFLTSCVSTAKFPVSNVVPAAEITAKKKQDRNKNYTIEVTANNLASPDRLNPPKNNYSVWILTLDNEVKNIGQLANKNAKKAVLKAVTPFDVKEVFITAEDQGDNSFPRGMEISRTNFYK